MLAVDATTSCLIWCFSESVSSIFLSQMQAQSKVELSVLGSWSLPKEGQEGMESFLRDLSTIFPQERWLQISREIGKTGFICQVLNRDQSKIHTEISDIKLSSHSLYTFFGVFSNFARISLT